MIEQILWQEVSAAEAFGDVSDVVLFPQEEKAIARAAEKRRREFATSRSCARQALAGLGIPPAPIVPGNRGAPQWPANVVGSITHCDGYRAAAVAFASEVMSIGLDAEPNQPLPEGVTDIVALPGELVQLPRLSAARPGPCWDRLLFSTKEAVYKAWFPLTQRWLDFRQAMVTIDPAAGHLQR